MMVTILTSLNDNDQKIIGSNNTVSQQVKKLAESDLEFAKSLTDTVT